MKILLPFFIVTEEIFSASRKIALFILLSLAASTVLSACSTAKLTQNSIVQGVKDVFDKSNKKTTLEVQEGDKLLASGQYQEAARLLMRLHQASPENAAVLLALAHAERLQGQYVPALSHYQQLLKMKDSTEEQNLQAQEGIGLCYMQQGKLNEAITLFHRIIEKDAARWKTINALGVAYAANQQPEKALPFYEMARELSEQHYSVLNNYALTQAMLGHYNEATDLLQQALAGITKQHPQWIRMQSNLALAYGVAGENEKAREVLSRIMTEEAVEENMKFYAQVRKSKKKTEGHLRSVLTGKKGH